MTGLIVVKFAIGVVAAGLVTVVMLRVDPELRLYWVELAELVRERVRAWRLRRKLARAYKRWSR